MAANVQNVLYARNEGDRLVDAGASVPWERTFCHSALASGQWESSRADVD